MKKIRPILLLALASILAIVGLLSAWTWPFPKPATVQITEPLKVKIQPTVLTTKIQTSIAKTTSPSDWIIKEEQIIKSKVNNMDEKVLRLSLLAYMNARKHGLDQKQMLTVIDYSKPANLKRMWVFDLKNNLMLFNTYVSHGKNSGGISATSFSNNEGSLKSSLGVFVTDQPYIGKNGYSLRISGLEHGYNDHALSRAIVIHGARYVNPATIQRYGQIGRSWGCPAISPTLARPIIDKIKDNTVIFAYYPDRSWLSHSQYLSG